jgi:alginate O-acetyltransferase complex protein AlgI
MLFNSLTFVVFFAVVMGGYWTLRDWSARKTLLLVASYLFYGAWNPPFALLLFGTTALDFFLGARIAQAGTAGTRKAWMIASVTVNLSILGFFKYGNFLLENFQWLLGRVGVVYVPPHLDLFLPIGISFYTFHSLSYTLDVYRRACEPTKSLRDFALAVSFFPQLVAGPIVRAADFLPQCAEPPKPQTNRLQWGLFLMSLGMFQKIVLADTLLAPISDGVFGHPSPVLTLDAWIGVIAFSGQIFFDFSGYSTCAIGAALCLGFHLKDNFLFPFAAVGFSDFWRRWHISLSTFLRDYLYIPLGGNRVGAARAAVNLIIVMFIGGLWHGAAWTFVVWGLIHGFCLVVEHFLRAATKGAGWKETLPVQLILCAITYFFVCIAWVFFRATSFQGAGMLLGAMAGKIPVGQAILSGREILQVLLVIAGLWFAHWRLRNTSLESAIASKPAWLIGVVWTLMLCAIILTQGSGNAFIYFQF